MNTSNAELRKRTYDDEDWINEVLFGDEPEPETKKEIEDFILTICLTNDHWIEKPIDKNHSASIHTLSAYELYHRAMNGYAYMPVIKSNKNSKKRGLGTWCKSNINFISSQILSIDIDNTSYSSIESVIENIPLKPTFWYNSYNHMKDGKVKGRLVYVLNKPIESVHKYRFISSRFIYYLEKCIGEKLVDPCSKNAVQFYYGTYNKKGGYFGDILNVDEFFNEEEYRTFIINNCGYALGHEWKDSALELWNKERESLGLPILTTDDTAFKSQEFQLKDKRWKDVMCCFDTYKHNIWECISWRAISQDSSYQLIDGYFSGEYISKNKLKYDEDAFKLPGYKLKDGMHRRRTLRTRSIIRRWIYFKTNGCEITPDLMMYNLMMDIVRFVEDVKPEKFSERVIDSRWIKQIVNYVLSISMEYVDEIVKKQKDKLREITIGKLKGEITQTESWNSVFSRCYDKTLNLTENYKKVLREGYVTRKETYRKWWDKNNKGDVDWSDVALENLIIDKWDADKLWSDNYNELESLCNDLSIPISESTVRRKVKELCLTWKKGDKKHERSKKHSDEEIVCLIDYNLSKRKNFELIKSMGKKLSRERFNKIYDEHK